MVTKFIWLIARASAPVAALIWAFFPVRGPIRFNLNGLGSGFERKIDMMAPHAMNRTVGPHAATVGNFWKNK